MHCITFAFSQYFMHFRCVFYMLKCCVLVGLDWAELIMFLLLHVTCSCIFHAYVLFFSSFDIDSVWYFSTSLSLSLSLFQMVCAWHPSAKLLRPRTLFILGHLLPLTLPPFTFNSMMIKPVRTFQKTFLDMAFIWNARSFFWTSPILIYPLSFTVGVRSSFVTSRSVVLSWSYWSFTPICVDLILPYLAFSFLFEVCV